MAVAAFTAPAAKPSIATPDPEFHTPIPVDSRLYTLCRKIPAIPSRGDAKLGPILYLPAGSQVQICGDGFNPRTVKVRHHHSYYFVFQEDLAG
jgi:hypothetical protein